MILYDTIELDAAAKVGFTAEGYLKALPRIARSGIQVYTGSECGVQDKEVIRVFRPEKEVFDAAAVHSYTHLPVTLDHPPEEVTPNNWKKYAVGETGDEVLRDGGSVRVPMMLRDAAAIKAYKDGVNQLSVGYACDLEMTSGRTEDGKEYDAIQRGIKANHLAVVAAARGGPTLVIGDDNKQTSWKGEDTMSELILRTILVDGMECKMPDTAASIVQRAIGDLERQLQDARKSIKELNEEKEDNEEESNAQDAALKAKDAALKEKDAAIAKAIEDNKARDVVIVDLQKKLDDALGELKPDKMNARAKDRLNVVTKCRDIIGPSMRDGTNEELRRQAVEHLYGDMVKNFDDKQIEALFLTAKTQNQPRHDGVSVQDVALAFGRPGQGYMTQEQVKIAAYDKYNHDLENAWRGPQHGATQ